MTGSGPDAGAPASAARRGPGWRRSRCVHHSQSCVSGLFPGLVTALGLPAELFSIDGFSAQARSASEGRHRLSDLVTTVGPTYAGDPDSSSGSASRHPGSPRGQAGRSERHRCRAMEPGDRSVSSRAYSSSALDGKLAQAWALEAFDSRLTRHRSAARWSGWCLGWWIRRFRFALEVRGQPPRAARHHCPSRERRSVRQEWSSFAAATRAGSGRIGFDDGLAHLIIRGRSS
jgi:hypothetical protein